jgi:transposase
MGQVKPIFSGKKVTVRIPRSMLRDDDGFLNAAAIVGTQGSPTDIAPNRGHLELSDGRPPAS